MNCAPGTYTHSFDGTVFQLTVHGRSADGGCLVADLRVPSARKQYRMTPTLSSLAQHDGGAGTADRQLLMQLIRLMVAETRAAESGL